MARLIGPDESVRVVYRTDGLAKAQGYTATVYADGAGTQLANIINPDDSAISGSVLTVDAYSKLPLFQFPDGVDTVYVTVNGGPIVPLYARTDDRIDGKVDVTLSRVSVASYGAKGNNTADDTTACQAAINALPVGGGEVYFPTGTYKLTGALTLLSGVTLVGDGDDTIVLRQTSTSASCVQGTNVERVGLRNLQLNGPGSGTGHGVNLAKGGGSHIAYVALENVTVTSFGGDGVRVENPIVSTFSRVISGSNGGYGINLFGQTAGAAGTSCSLNSCYGNGNTTGGFRLYNIVYSALNGCAADHNPIAYLLDTCQAVTLSGCGAEGNTTGAKISAGYSNTVTGLWVYDNRGVGVWVTGSAGTVSLIGVVDNSPNASATNFIKVDTGSRATLLNCSNTTTNSLASGTTNVASDAGGGVQFQGYAALVAGGEFDADLTCYASSKGIVLSDRSNGHTYRLKVTNGVLAVEQVT